MSKYLITFDLDTTKLKTLYHGKNYNNAYYDIRSTLSRRGFENIQGSVYLGQEGISEAHGTIAIQELTAKEGANKQVISSQADSLIKISRIWADFFPQTHRISLFRLFFPPFLALFPVFTEISPTDVSFGPPETGWPG
jgi:virulence-associated protein VapD